MSITRSEMRTRIQLRIGDSSGNFYGNTLYNSIIQSRVDTWAGKIASLAPNYYLEHTSYTGVDDAIDSAYEFYDFPSDFRTFVKLERVYGSGNEGTVYQTITVINSEDQDRYKFSSVGYLVLPDSLSNYEQTVSVWGAKLRILPAPSNNSYEYRLKYLRKPSTLSADESLLDIPDEWGEVIALDSAIFVLSQLGDPTVNFLRPLLKDEVKLMKDEHRRKTMDSESLPRMDKM